MNRAENLFASSKSWLLLALVCTLPPAWSEEAKKTPVEPAPAMELLELLGEERPADPTWSDPLRWLEDLRQDKEPSTKERKHD